MFEKTIRNFGLVLLTMTAPISQAGWQDLLKGAQDALPIATPGSSGGASSDSTGQSGQASSPASSIPGFGSSLGGSAVAALSDSEVASGLKETLGNAVETSVRELSKTGGYLNKANVRIPLPGALAKTEGLLRKAGQGKAVDEFVTSMNSAAEQAVAESAPILGDAIRNLSFADAKAILQGGETAATDYLRRVSSSRLTARFRPLVETATDKVGVTGYYKQLMTQAKPYMGFASQFVGQDVGDLDAYVTQGTVDGLFTTLAEQERQIRSNPGRWSSNLLQKVLGAVR